MASLTIKSNLGPRTVLDKIFIRNNFSQFLDYEENRRKRLGDISPTRIKYKKLKR